jgi:methoxymalonate biosynthesis protein
MSDDTTGWLAILGAGVMGAGITTLAVGSGLSAVLVDVDEERLERARASVAQQVRLGQLMGSFSADTPAGELETTTDISRVAGTTAVIESVTERVELKARALSGATAVLSPARSSCRTPRPFRSTSWRGTRRVPKTSSASTS